MSTYVSQNVAAVTDASRLLLTGLAKGANEVIQTIQRFGAPAITFALQTGIRIYLLAANERYTEASGALRRLGVDVDGWPASPAGLFVCEERCVYLRSRSQMTVAHEFGHALDLALGGGIYLSSTDHGIRLAFQNAKSYVTPYAATGTDEFFAECMRAFVDCNDTASFWPRATPERLRATNPEMYDLLNDIFSTRLAAALKNGERTYLGGPL